MAKTVVVTDLRRGGSTEQPKSVTKKIKDARTRELPTAVKAVGTAAVVSAKAGAKVGKRTTKVVAGATAAIVLAVGKFSLKRVAPWTSVLVVRVFAGDDTFKALSALTLACNLARVKNVVERVAGRSGSGSGSSSSSSSADGAATAAATAVSSAAKKMSPAAAARAVAKASDALEARVTVLFSPFIRRLAVPTALVHLTPRVLVIAAPGVLRSMRFYGHLLPVIAGRGQQRGRRERRGLGGGDAFGWGYFAWLLTDSTNVSRRPLVSTVHRSPTSPLSLVTSARALAHTAVLSFFFFKSAILPRALLVPRLLLNRRPPPRVTSRAELSIRLASCESAT